MQTIRDVSRVRHCVLGCTRFPFGRIEYGKKGPRLLYEKLRYSSLFFCYGDPDHLSTGANSSTAYGFLVKTFSDVIDGALKAHTF